MLPWTQTGRRFTAPESIHTGELLNHKSGQLPSQRSPVADFVCRSLEAVPWRRDDPRVQELPLPPGPSVSRTSNLAASCLISAGSRHFIDREGLSVRTPSSVRVEDKTDTAQFLRLLKPLQRPLELYARRMLRDPSRCEDVVQEAVLKAFRDFAEFVPGTSFRAWIFRYLTFHVLNANRKYEPMRLDEIPADLAVEEDWEEAPRAEEAFGRLLDDPERLVELLDEPLAQALCRLTAPERSCLLLKSIGEFSCNEIHQMLGIPVASVMGYLSRARRRMRVFLGDYAIEFGWTSDIAAASPESGRTRRGGGEGGRTP